MKIYNVIPIYKGENLVVVAKSESEAIKMAVDYFNQYHIGQFEPDDFCASTINADEFSESTIIN